jgi:argininosuccinate lyase
LAGTPSVRLSAIVKAKYAHLYAGVAEVACVSDVASTDEILGAAYSLMRGEPFDAVVAPLERSIVSAAYLRSYLGIPGMDLPTAARFANKFVMKRRLRADGIPVADFTGLADVGELRTVVRALGLPVVLKPAVGAGTQKTWLLRSETDLDEFLAGSGPASVAGVPMLVERFVPMRTELHCDAVVVDGAVVSFSASRYFCPLLSDMGGLIGSYTLHESDPLHSGLRDLHDRVIGVLGLDSGVTHLESFDTSSGLVMSEVTCRPGGGGVPHVIETKHGWDIWQGLVATALGRPVPVTHRAPDPAVTGWCGLPGRNGVITELTDPDELLRIDGVTRVEMTHRIGQDVSEKMTSTFNAGIAYFTVPDYQRAESVHRELRARYRIRTRAAGKRVKR